MQSMWVAAVAALACSRLAAADDGPPGEVIVVEDRTTEPEQTRITKDELHEVSGALGDPVRAATAQPGMVPTDANRPEVYVRGAPPGNTALFIDGVRVPLLFHGGVATSVIPASLIAAVDTFASAAPARYGGMAGGVIELETTAVAPRPRAEARLTVFEGGGLVETPVANGRGSVLAAARFGDPQLILGLVSDADVKLRYWDYESRATWRVGDHDSIGLLVFGSHDHLSEQEPSEDPAIPESFVDQLVSDFHRADLRYDHVTSTSRWRAALDGGWTVQGAGGLRVRDLSYSARVDGELRVAGSVLARVGAHLDRDDYAVRDVPTDDPATNSPADALPPPRNTIGGAYADVVWDVTRHLRIVPGIRFDVYDSTRAVDGASGAVPAVEPRLAARWRVIPELALTASAGLAHQLPLLRVGSAPVTAISVPGFWAGARRLQRARQATAGVEWLLPEGMVGTATLFASQTHALTDLTRSCEHIHMPGMEPISACGDAPSTGFAYGLELSLRRPLTERIGGWLAYTFSRASEDTATGTLASPFDRTHVASAAITYQLTSNWRIGSRITVYSGAPFVLPTTGNQIRLPWFQRVDLRADRTWKLASGGSLAVVIDILNATLSRAHDQVTCDMSSCTIGEGNLFFVPSVGIEGTF